MQGEATRVVAEEEEDEEDNMKSRTVMSFTAMTFIRCDGNAAPACRTGQAGQPQTPSLQAHRRGDVRRAVKLLQLSQRDRCIRFPHGVLQHGSGPQTHKGGFVGFANTSSPDPYAGLCYVPDGFVASRLPMEKRHQVLPSLFCCERVKLTKHFGDLRI